ncbi:hypothetical protein NDU88_001521, partial [Pleurodeles waltl]
MARLKMKTWMGFLFALSFLQTGYCQCTGCASDEICNTDTSTCDCDLNLYTRSAWPLSLTRRLLNYSAHPSAGSRPASAR